MSQQQQDLSLDFLDSDSDDADVDDVDDDADNDVDVDDDADYDVDNAIDEYMKNEKYETVQDNDINKYNKMSKEEKEETFGEVMIYLNDLNNLELINITKKDIEADLGKTINTYIYNEARKHIIKTRVFKNGTKAEVYYDIAEKTPGGLGKKDLMKNKHGKIISKKQHYHGFHRVKHLFKLGYRPCKEGFKLFEYKERRICAPPNEPSKIPSKYIGKTTKNIFSENQRSPLPQRLIDLGWEQQPQKRARPTKIKQRRRPQMRDPNRKKTKKKANIPFRRQQQSPESFVEEAQPIASQISSKRQQSIANSRASAQSLVEDQPIASQISSKRQQSIANSQAKSNSSSQSLLEVGAPSNVGQIGSRSQLANTNSQAKANSSSSAQSLVEEAQPIARRANKKKGPQPQMEKRITRSATAAALKNKNNNKIYNNSRS